MLHEQYFSKVSFAHQYPPLFQTHFVHHSLILKYPERRWNFLTGTEVCYNF